MSGKRPEFVILAKNKETKKSTRIGSGFTDKYGGTDIILSKYDKEKGERVYAKAIVWDDGEKTVCKEYYINCRADKPREKPEGADMDDFA